MEINPRGAEGGLPDVKNEAVQYEGFEGAFVFEDDRSGVEVGNHDGFGGRESKSHTVGVSPCSAEFGLAFVGREAEAAVIVVARVVGNPGWEHRVLSSAARLQQPERIA